MILFGMRVEIPDTGPVFIRIDSQDTWSADQTLALIIAPVLAQLRGRKMGIPGSLISPDHHRHDDARRDEEFQIAVGKWQAILDEMIWAFETVAKGDGVADDPDVRPRLQSGLELFAKHYFDLWE